MIEDLAHMPQHPTAYLSEVSAAPPLIDKATQLKLAQEFLARHFAPWQERTPLEETQHPFWALEWIESGEGYGHNLLPLPHDAVDTLRRRCNPADYPSLQRHAITINLTDVRALPTAAPIFSDPLEPGQGFPFDYLQHGVLPPGTPLLVSHTSRDGNWRFIETPLLYGWVRATAIARVDGPFKDAYTTSEYVTIVQDGKQMRTTEGGALPPTRIGMILPLLKHTDRGYRVAIPQVNEHGDAILGKARISSAIAHPFPLRFSPTEVARLGERFMLQPYSWGDRFEGRDCSGTTRDLFAPFGIWLPRNSDDQARTGSVISLKEKSAAEKRNLIASQAIPFATLLHLPGHIMLYLGEYDGKIAVLHTLWGIRLSSPCVTEQRIRVGKTVITSLEPGREIDGFRFEISSLLERLERMNIPHGRSPE